MYDSNVQIDNEDGSNDSKETKTKEQSTTAPEGARKKSIGTATQTETSNHL